MKKRTFEEIMESKALYRKHAARYKANDYPENRAKRMLAYSAKLTKAIAVSSQEARTSHSVTIHEEMEAERKQTSTDEQQPPQFIRENCRMCDNSLYAREVMEYTGKVEEVPFIQDDGTKLMEYEYLYKCCRCSSLLWVPEDWVKENAVDQDESKAIYQKQEECYKAAVQVEQPTQHVQVDAEQLCAKIERHNTYYFIKNKQLDSVTDAHRYIKRASLLGTLSLAIGKLELQYIRLLRQRWERT